MLKLINQSDCDLINLHWINAETVSLEDIKKMIKENRAIYDYKADMRENKWAGEKKLEISSKAELPVYINLNYEKYKDWF